MKNLILFTLALLGLMLETTRPSQAQPASRSRNLFHVSFVRDWDLALNDPVKLIEIGQITDAKTSNVLMLVGGKDQNDYKRHLLLTHWDGFRFSTDATLDFLGTATDALLLGHFRSGAPLFGPLPAPGKPGTAGTAPATRPDKPAKKGAEAPENQIITTEGIYYWTGSSLARLFAAPADIRLALLRDKVEDELVAGAGDSATAYQVGQNYVKEATDGAPTEGGGYVRFGVGMQDYTGNDKTKIDQNVRMVQTYWKDRFKWLIGLAPGSPQATPNAPNATTGDRLVVYVPKFSSKGKTFWESKLTDFEEDWRSDPLPGRVLDIRLGDPRNEGKIGILILTAENNDKDRHLYFYRLSEGLGGN